MKNNKILDEYYLLTVQLDEVNWALEGDCNDIDCDKYMYKDLLLKKYKPVLEHNFSCTESLQRQKETLLRILSLKRYDKVRHKKCSVCKKRVDKLAEESTVVSYTKPSGKWVRLESQWCHRACEDNVRIPTGWSKF